MRKLVLLNALLLLFCLNTVFAQPVAETLTNKSIIELQKAGFGKDIILAKIETANSKFDVSTAGMVQLKKAGVDEDVINAMITKGGAKKTAGNNTASNTATHSAKGTVPEPDIINLIHYYDKALNKATPLEKATAQMRTRRKALGYGGVNFVFELSSPKSAVRLTPAEAPSFIVNTGGGAADAFVLYKLQIKNGARQAIATNFGAFGDLKGSEGVISINIKMLKPGVFELMPAATLEKGEYFFASKSAGNATTTSNAEVYAFGID